MSSEQAEASPSKPARDEYGRLLPGNTANPNGRKPGTFSLVAMLKAKLEEVEPKNQKTYAALLIERIAKNAIVDGDPQQIKNILQYVEGMPKQPIEHMGPDGEPITVNFVNLP